MLNCQADGMQGLNSLESSHVLLERFFLALELHDVLLLQEDKQTRWHVFRLNNTDTVSSGSLDSQRSPSHLLLVGKLLVFLGQDLGQVQIAHLRMYFGIFGSFLHEESKVRCQGLLREIWVSLDTKEVRGHQSV